MRRRECPKCGSRIPDVKYDTETDELRCRCISCQYRWTEKTIDNLPAGATPQRVFPVAAVVIAFLVIVVTVALVLGTGGGHS